MHFNITWSYLVIMNTSVDLNEAGFLLVKVEIDDFFKKLEEKIDKEQEQLKARRKKNELECKMAQELKINGELTQQLSELNKWGSELDRVTATFQAGLTIGDNDRDILEKSKDMYEIAKELTGIRFDFSAPPEVVRGFIKSKQRRLLLPFEEPAGADLWPRLAAAAAPAWPHASDENNKMNK